MKLVYIVPPFEMALGSKVSCLGCRQKQWFFLLELSMEIKRSWGFAVAVYLKASLKKLCLCVFVCAGRKRFSFKCLLWVGFQGCGSTNV